MSPNRHKIEGLGHIKEGPLFYDLAMGWLQLAALPDREADSVAQALRQIAGNTIKHIYSDRAGEFQALSKHLKIEFTTSLPGEPQTNSLIERQVQVVPRGARALLAAAGLPQAFWAYAASTFCHLKNIQKDAEGYSAWQRRKAEDFPGYRIPFGTLVDFTPPPTTQEAKGKGTI